MSEQKPREFWADHIDDLDDGKCMEWEVFQTPKENAAFHVIEYSAYEAVCKERDQLNCDYELKAAAHYRCSSELCDVEDERDKLRAELENERLRLAGCGVAAMQNTEKTVKNRITRDNPSWSASYGDVCSAVDREIKLRADLAVAVEALEEINIPYQSFFPQKMPRLPDVIIREALAKIKTKENL